MQEAVDREEKLAYKVGEDGDARYRVLETLAQAISGRRQEAIAGRAASGIEKEWEGDEEFYIGIDDAKCSIGWCPKETATGAAWPRSWCFWMLIAP